MRSHVGSSRRRNDNEVLRGQPVPAYPDNSIAFQNRSQSDVYGYAHQGTAYPNGQGAPVTRMGIGGAPAEGETHGRGFGQTVGNGIGRVFGAIFTPVNYVMNGGVNVLRGIEDSTGMQGLGVGVTQNPGQRYGRPASNFSFTGSYGGGGNNRAGSGRKGNVFGGGDNGGRNQPATVANTGYFQWKPGEEFKFFGGARDIEIERIYAGNGRLSDADNKFLAGYNDTAKRYNGHLATVDEDKRVNGVGNPRYVSDIKPDESTAIRTEVFESILYASMQSEGKDPSSNGYIYIAGKEYRNDIIRSGYKPPINLPQDKETLDLIKTAYGNLSPLNQGFPEFYNILRTKRGPELEIALANFADPARFALRNRLGPEGKQLFDDISRENYPSGSPAAAVQSAMLTNPELWEGGKGVVTDTDRHEARVGIFMKGQHPTLTFMNGDEIVEMAIPKAHWGKVFETIGDISIRDRANDLAPEDYLKEIREVVKNIDTPEAGIFNKATLDYEADREMQARQVAEAKEAAEKAQTAATEATKEAETAKAKAEEQVQTAEARVTKLEGDVGKIREDIAFKIAELNVAKADEDTDLIVEFSRELIALRSTLAGTEHEIGVANRKLAEAQDYLETGTNALAEANAAAKEAEAELAKFEPKPIEVKTEKSGIPSQQDIEATADTVIAALKLNPVYNELDADDKSFFGKKVNSEEIRAGIISGTNDYFAGKEGVPSPEQAIKDMKSRFAIAGVTFTPEMIDMISNVIQEKLGINVKEAFASNEANQQQNPLNPNQLYSAGEVRTV